MFVKNTAVDSHFPRYKNDVTTLVSCITHDLQSQKQKNKNRELKNRFNGSFTQDHFGMRMYPVWFRQYAAVGDSSRIILICAWHAHTCIQCGFRQYTAVGDSSRIILACACIQYGLWMHSYSKACDAPWKWHAVETFILIIIILCQHTDWRKKRINKVQARHTCDHRSQRRQALSL